MFDYHMHSRVSFDGHDPAQAMVEAAVAAGDKNVYFIPGTELLIPIARETGLGDNCHPNDMGFVSMANVIYPTLKEILHL